jgi:hypothetical protein
VFLTVDQGWYVDEYALICNTATIVHLITYFRFLSFIVLYFFFFFSSSSSLIKGGDGGIGGRGENRV